MTPDSKRQALEERTRKERGRVVQGLSPRLGRRGGFPKEMTFMMRREAKKKGKCPGGERKFQAGAKRNRKWAIKGGISNGGHSLTLSLSPSLPFSLSLSLPRTWLCPGPLPPCCHLGSPLNDLPSLASFTPPLPFAVPSNWPRLSAPFLPPVAPELPFPGSSTPGTLLPGPICAPAAQHFPELPLLARLAQGAEERLRLWSLRPEGLEVKPETTSAPREGFSSERQGTSTGEEGPASPSLASFKAVWPLDPP